MPPRAARAREIAARFTFRRIARISLPPMRHLARRTKSFRGKSGRATSSPANAAFAAMNFCASELSFGFLLTPCFSRVPAHVGNFQPFQRFFHGVSKPLLRLVQWSGGARASARFNVHRGAAQEIPGPLPLRALKRCERRAPFAPYVCHSILRFSIKRLLVSLLSTHPAEAERY